MRTFAVAFAILYVLLVLSATAERTAETVADAGSHSSRHQDPTSSELKRLQNRLTQTKINEPGFVVELSRESVGVPVLAERHVPVASFEFRSAPAGPLFSTRAPPSLI